ncbi:MAG TPA: FMN-binding negative transcriptional regulator, partial [Bdellovibrio sp.]|nr:FMN-binding negative transcriptional regulator [Bdellovibrio sp.]
MYLPKHFSAEEWKKISDLIQQNSFATVLSFPENEKPFINHLPIIFDRDLQNENILIGHMAKRNPQWLHFKKNPECTLIFHGPHTYITPRWYKSGRDVPTWNYAVVHLHGKIELLEKFEEQIDVLKKLSEYFEGNGPNLWQFELPDDLLNEEALKS